MSLLLLFNDPERVGWYPCCCPSCRFVLESFNRADGTDITTGSAAGWTETAGDWSISGNTLQVSSANAIVLCDTEHPEGGAWVYISTNVKASATGDQARVYLNRVDANNCCFAEWTCGPAGTLKIFERASGTDTELASLEDIVAVADEWHNFRFCVNATTLRAQLGVLPISADFATATSPVFGLGTGVTVTGPVQFDDFTVSRVSEECSECRRTGLTNGCEVGDPCEKSLIANYMDVDIPEGLTDAECGDACSTFNGVYTAFRNPFIGSGGACRWIYGSSADADECDYWVTIDIFYESRAEDGFSGCKWWAFISVQHTFNSSTYIYRDVASSGTDGVLEAPLELLYFGEIQTGTNPPCAGTIPASVTIQSVL